MSRYPIVEATFGLWTMDMPKIDPFDQLAEDMARALRKNYRIDALGRRCRENREVRLSRAACNILCDHGGPRRE